VAPLPSPRARPRRARRAARARRATTAPSHLSTTPARHSHRQQPVALPRLAAGAARNPSPALGRAQASTCKLGGTGAGHSDVYVPFSSLLPMVNPNDIVLGGWDISSMNLADCMTRAKVRARAPPPASARRARRMRRARAPRRMPRRAAPACLPLVPCRRGASLPWRRCWT
jgi:hypothetical protein